jgi:hypothetical protein
VSTLKQVEQIEQLEKWVKWLDDGLEIPFFKKRIGFDPIIGLIPGLGDFITLLFHAIPLYVALKIRVSSWVLARMLLNSLIDISLGSIPILGDLFDFFFLAHRRNYELIKTCVSHQDKITNESKTIMFIWTLCIMLVFIGFLVGFLWLIFKIINQFI